MYDISRNFILIYIISFFSGVSCITMLFLICKKEKNKLCFSLKNFSIAFFFLLLVNFVDYYRVYFFSKWEMNVLLMCLSNLSLVVFTYLWIKLVKQVYGDLRMGKWFTTTITFSILYLVTGCIVYLFYMNKEYIIYNMTGKLLAMIPSSIFYITLIGINLYYIFVAIKCKSKGYEKNYFIAISIMVILCNCWLYFSDCALIFYPLGSSIYKIYPFTPLIFFYFVINIWTITYLYKEYLLSELQIDPLDSANNANITTNNTNTNGMYSIDEITEKFHLTNREKELTQLVSLGLSNVEISSLLNISTGTVKRHNQNIFRKLNIKNRFELICLVKKS